MRTETVPQTVLFPDLFDKPLVATFDQQHASSDGGAVLLKAAEREYGLIGGFAECLVDDRQPGKVRHTLEDLLGQRIFGIACGHPDGNDADRLADDPIHKLRLGRDTRDGRRARLATDGLALRKPRREPRALWNWVRTGTVSSSGITGGGTGVRAGSRSISTPPRMRPMATSSSPSSTATTTPGVTSWPWPRTRCSGGAAEPAMTAARAQSEASGQTEHAYTHVRYAAASWGQARRVLATSASSTYRPPM